ncbi:DUF397 domain-containing protein [Streptomyces griseocarneus]|nr:DUF397 domain-containing protein [Streptomyces griseocarneus]
MNRADLNRAIWRKSSHSNSNSNCVEVADRQFPGSVPVRDSKAPAGPALSFSAAAWSSFVAGVKSDVRDGA